ncbi:CotH kinase family protein [Brevibacillus humidisoli]|uniref:CotH kinase family protein n=1 Tax=Brevibacillus humidisoli TaxID=2895522 RepID=UPI001E523E34|nr:CotH kinase family protein [Brevibacillus humidisoli]UFJ41051.1 CotH kinase family protein [Brevibacillus humidisoli]
MARSSRNIRPLVWLLLIAIIIGGCQPAEPDQQPQPVTSQMDENGEYTPKLVENRLVYEDDQPDTIAHLYVTVTDDNLTAEQPFTWAQLNKISNVEEKKKAGKLNVIVQEGTAEGPESGLFGYDASHPNATITVRGASSLRRAQKSYKIKLFDSAGYWRNHQTINLNKHVSDFSRMRNKLSFDYFTKIPHMTSLRTQFVHLHVRDMTGGGPAQFVDYGLFTQIEHPNKSFLRMHGLDPYGHLYKASFFEFLRYPDQLKLADDAGYDKEAFESILEIDGSNDHSKLLQMLDDVNDMGKDFDEVFETHFDRDNFLTWMAANILMDNIDTNSQNFFLYSPLNSQKWFFLPWDYDGTWGYFETYGQKPGRRAPWQRGIANYWGSVLQKRFFKNPENVQQLVDKVEELSQIITPEENRRLIETYKPIVSSYVRRAPDVGYLPGPLDLYDEELQRIIEQPPENKRKFIESLQNPMPFFLGDVRQEQGKLTFNWDPSYDFQGDDVTYHFQLAKEPTFARPLVDRDGLTGTTLQLDAMEQGRYFWRVIVTDAQGNSMSAFDTYRSQDDVYHHGVREFYVE